ncbi:L-aspartate oxidase [Alkalibaculum sp. M08DMB]|uniref:L-aspartate oxidase n=1 Tax=Alkalibaculum sporogenes TaxID=2655001 RepID=A0A6A7K6H6_9FIRM|nr:L-aspartate oxidase [Alkalibaculum sporogenes]MPW25089.1 L-aspartate oxidase [Alkalibaculum sporogenes]
MNQVYDVVIVGSGLSGLYCALNLDSNLNILIVSKGQLDENNTYLAQGGISTAKNDEDLDSYIQDTLNAGQHKNDISAVTTLAKESMENITLLEKLGVPFDRIDGNLSFTKEGAHSINRIVHVKDETGKYLWKTLIDCTKEKSNITIMDNTYLADIIYRDNTCYGGIIFNKGKQVNVYSKFIVLATGGIGGIFNDSTSQRILIGDAITLALKHNIKVKDLEYIQFHPTGLYDNDYYGRRFLISEAVRGEGGILLNEHGKRFVNELLPRDIVTNAIREEIRKSKVPYVFLDISFLPKYFILKRFPMIYEKCLQVGIDISKDPMLVIPSQHYHMGGVMVDLDSKSSMHRLYVIGEAACTGIHGKNRLASNSLLEGLVFSKRGADSINSSFQSITIKKVPAAQINQTPNELSKYNKQLLKKELQRRSSDLYDELFDNR